LLLVPAGSANRLFGIVESASIVKHNGVIEILQGVQGCIAEVTFPRQEVLQMQK
jgi:hypothetical protein